MLQVLGTIIAYHIICVRCVESTCSEALVWKNTPIQVEATASSALDQFHDAVHANIYVSSYYWKVNPANTDMNFISVSAHMYM